MKNLRCCLYPLTLEKLYFSNTVYYRCIFETEAQNTSFWREQSSPSSFLSNSLASTIQISSIVLRHFNCAGGAQVMIWTAIKGCLRTSGASTGGVYYFQCKLSPFWLIAFDLGSLIFF